MLGVLAGQHKGTPAGDCIAARIDELKKQELVSATPPAAAKPAPSKAAEPAVAVFNPARASAPLNAAEERTLKPGDSFRECPGCAEVVVVPAGEFVMGWPENQVDWNEGRSKPQHRVTIARPFAVGKYEVTFAEWDACVAAGGCKHRPGDQGWGRGRRPVINVSWHDAKEYAAWLSRKTGKAYRLLSEAEWEYAARSGTTTNWAFGDNLTESQAQFNAAKTVVVGSFAANRFGLHDMHGNVEEWVEDAWHPNYNGAPDDGSVWAGGDTSLRVRRGGGWASWIPGNLGSPVRFRPRPGGRDSWTGFRLARTL